MLIVWCFLETCTQSELSKLLLLLLLLLLL